MRTLWLVSVHVVVFVTLSVVNAVASCPPDTAEAADTSSFNFITASTASVGFGYQTNPFDYHRFLPGIAVELELTVPLSHTRRWRLYYSLYGWQGRMLDPVDVIGQDTIAVRGFGSILAIGWYPGPLFGRVQPGIHAGAFAPDGFHGVSRIIECGTTIDIQVYKGWFAGVTWEILFSFSAFDFNNIPDTLLSLDNYSPIITNIHIGYNF